MRLGEQHFLTSKSPEILQMIVNHNISLYTILPPAKNHLLPSDERGLLTKVHGGAIAESGIPIEFTDRLNTGIAAKQQMATKVIPLFHAGDILLMDGGTSNLEVAKQLPTDIPLSVYTNSFPIVNTLFNHPKLDLILLRGKCSLLPRSHSEFPSSRHYKR